MCHTYSKLTVQKFVGVIRVSEFLSLKIVNMLSYNFFSNFEIKNRKKNDFVMGEYIAKNWPVRSCSHSTTTTTGVPFCPKKIYDHPNCLPKCLCKHESCKTPKSADYIRKLVANIFIWMGIFVGSTQNVCDHAIWTCQRSCSLLCNRVEQNLYQFKNCVC